VAAAGDWPTIVAAYEPEAAVWDLGAGGSFERPPELEALGVPVLALVADEEQGAEALAAGARAVLFRNADAGRLAAALAAATRGLVVIDEAVAAPLRPRPVSSPLPEALTPREREVLQLISQGLANKRIAELLGIGERTVKFHVNAILGKLGAESRTEAVVLALRLGLVTL
jgi:DNA-binding NarL/FixJ family response regulator